MRITRLPYWGCVTAYVVWAVAVIPLLMLSVGDVTGGTGAIVGVGIAVFGMLVWVASCRARDMGRSPHWCWTLLIPVGNLIPLIWLGCAKSEPPPRYWWRESGRNPWE